MPKKKELKPILEEKLKEQLKEPEKSITREKLQEPEKPIIHRHRRTKIEIEASKQTLPEIANPLFIPILKIPFDAWAETIHLEELRLSEQEVNSLALPVTQLVNYYLPKMPAIAYAWCGLILSLYAIMQPRLKQIKELKKAKKDEQPPVKEISQEDKATVEVKT